MAKKTKPNGHLRMYSSYVFRTKDPAIAEYLTELEDHFGRRVNYKDLRTVHELSGVSASTMSGWFFGKTRRPSNATLEAAGRAIGRKRVWVAHKPNK